VTFAVDQAIAAARVPYVRTISDSPVCDTTPFCLLPDWDNEKVMRDCARHTFSGACQNVHTFCARLPRAVIELPSAKKPWHVCCTNFARGK